MNGLRAICRECIYRSLEVRRFGHIEDARRRNRTTIGAMCNLAGALMLRLLGDSETYDARRAKRLFRYEHGGQSEAGHFWEDLHRSSHGRYFLNTFGGAESKYGWMFKDGDRIHHGDLVPLSKEAAHEWVSERFGPDRIGDVLNHNP